MITKYGKFNTPKKIVKVGVCTNLNNLKLQQESVAEKFNSHYKTARATPNILSKSIDVKSSTIPLTHRMKTHTTYETLQNEFYGH
jgi:hypothetical protein